jgi:UDP-N-acetylmuramate dehydrogenase
MNDQFLTELQNVMGGSGIFMEEPMKKHTTFRVGGPADVLVQPDETALAAILALCRRYHMSYSFIGNGSNLLVGDKGIRGVVIEMTDPMGNIEVDGTKITAQAGAMLSKIANTAASNGLGGMEFAAGIPGSVGGAVVMNAGAYGGEMKDIIEKVYVLDENGAQLELDRDALDLGYRHSCIPEKKYIVTKVVLELVPRNEAEIRSEMKELNEKRAEKQPLQFTFYVDVVNVYGSKNASNLPVVNLQRDASDNGIIANPNAPQDQQYYLLDVGESDRNMPLPYFGFIFEF